MALVNPYRTSPSRTYSPAPFHWGADCPNCSVIGSATDIRCRSCATPQDLLIYDLESALLVAVAHVKRANRAELFSPANQPPSTRLQLLRAKEVLGF